LIAPRFQKVAYSTWLVYQDEPSLLCPGTSGRPGSFEHTPDDSGDISSDIRDFSQGMP
jgi:hypothetical protein